MLIQRLKELERDEIIVRINFKEIPPKVEYSLTRFRRSLAVALGALCAWSVEHMQAVERISEHRMSAVSAVHK
ncbi:winged helix-turn-helix transcriptional regulator [Pseudomonas cannabina pv. alisalensis]|nr:winged helix-turn-helix transcriptional regulator [Pseudomonas syringae group genomosp. 3]KPB71366.1 putative transcriptional regulator [Pseudomonas syringae pv. maculicola]UBY97982.1 winged helix-turn-helix transcriptional regulator [Pseudomonas cannabina pv. alisalensis]